MGSPSERYTASPSPPATWPRPARPPRVPHRASELFLPTLREAPAEAEAASHRLLARGGFVRQVGAGLYSFLPLGWRTQQRVTNVIREELAATGAQEMLMPLITPERLWRESGRAEVDILYRLRDRAGQDFVLAMSHEETATLHARELRSYRELPQVWFHFATKGRDELRPRGGLLRVREFVMCDAYSFDRDADGLAETYANLAAAYRRIFERCELEVYEAESDTGLMGGHVAHEYLAPCAAGEDVLVRCPRGDYAANLELAVSEPDPGGGPAPSGEVQAGDPCPECGSPLLREAALEVGNIFQLGSRYSDCLGASYATDGGGEAPLVMGSYGIGPGRVMAAAVEQNHDELGISWPPALAPFDAHVVALGAGADVAERLAAELAEAGAEVLLDDRRERAGAKLADADLIGCPVRVLAGNAAAEEGVVEVHLRRQSRTEQVAATAEEIVRLASLPASEEQRR